MKNVMLAAMAVGAAGLSASAATVNATITADNHYALFTSFGSTMVALGGNELGAAGNPGTYNWSLPETYHFEAGEYIYIAAWSDKSVAQGVLANISIEGGGTLNSGDPTWEVMTTGILKGDGSARPLASEVASQALTADLTSKWETPFVGGANGVQPWGVIAGIDTQAKWMWRQVAGVADPLHGGIDAGEYLIFRTPVPTPGSMALLGLGALGVARRRR